MATAYVRWVAHKAPGPAAKPQLSLRLQVLKPMDGAETEGLEILRTLDSLRRSAGALTSHRLCAVQAYRLVAHPRSVGAFPVA